MLFFGLAQSIPPCAIMGPAEQAMNIHQRPVENGFPSNILILNTLLDIYAKCGTIQKAQKLFDKTDDAHPVSWNVMIQSYAIHGYNRCGFMYCFYTN